MYILERTIGVLVYVFVCFIVCYYISYKMSDIRKLNKVLLIFNIILSIMAFLYVPAPSADLYRHYEELKVVSTYSFQEICDYILNSSIPMYRLLISLVSKTGIPGLLPAITSFVFYSCLFSIICDIAKNNNIDCKSVGTALLFFLGMGKFLEVISGIRCLLSFSVICWCIYNELAKNKNILRNIVYYLFACLLHPAAIAFTLIRIVYLFFQKSKHIITKYALSTCLIIYFLKYPNSYIESMFSKAEIYLNNEIYFYFWEFVINLLSFLFIFYTLLKYRSYLACDPSIKNYSKFLFCFAIVVACFCFEYSIFSRFQCALSFMFTPILAYVLSDIKKENNVSKSYRFALNIVMISIFLFACTRGNLCGYKFFVLK